MSRNESRKQQKLFKALYDLIISIKLKEFKIFALNLY